MPSPPDLPPDKVVFFEYAEVSGSAGGGDGYRGEINHNSATFSLQNPLGGETITSPDGRHQSITGKAYTTIGNASRALRVPLTARSLSAVVSFSSAIQYASWVSADASVYYSAEIIDRRVNIFRPGARDEVTGADGTIHGDTVYSYWDEVTHWPFVGRYHQEVWQQFYGQTFGEWYSASLHWTPSTSVSLDNSFMELLIPDGSPNYVRANDWPFAEWQTSLTKQNSQTITLTAVDDRDGFTADAKYELTIHDRVEEPSDKTHKSDVDDGYLPGKWWGAANAGDERFLTDVAGGWSFGGISIPGILPWFPQFGINYTTSSTAQARPVTLPFDLPPNAYGDIMKINVVVSHFLQWREYDEGGQVYADPNNHNMKHSDTASEVQDIKYRVDGPHYSSGSGGGGNGGGNPVGGGPVGNGEPAP